MALSIFANDYEDRVIADFEHVLNTDKGGFSVPEVRPGNFDEASYVQTQHSFAKDLVNAVINSFPDHTVFVYGVNSTYSVIDPDPPHRVVEIKRVGGMTIAEPNGVGTGLKPHGIVTIIYDTEACSGKGTYRFAEGDDEHPDGVPIRGGSEIALFHELCHAFHWLNGDHIVDRAEEEFRTTEDENWLRAEEGLPLRGKTSRKGGCCGDKFVPKCPGGCLIVTAASGSDRSAEVEAFRLIRDKILRGSLLGDRFIAALLAEYHQFSPRVADDIRASDSLKAAVNAFIVGPLLDFLFLLEGHIRWGWQRPALFRTVVQQTLERTLALPVFAAMSNQDVSALASKLERLAVPQLPEAEAWAGLPPESSGPERLVDYFAEKMCLSSAERPYMRWGLVRPLALYWRSMERFISSSEVGSEVSADFVLAIEEWLSCAPLPAITRELSDETLRQEIGILAQSAMAVPHVRVRFEGRIAAARMTSTSAAVLRQAPGDEVNQRDDCGCR